MTGIRDCNPIWDNARAQAGVTRIYEDEAVLIATDFEGGNGTDFRLLGDNHYALRLEPEPGQHRFENAAYYVNFGIRNKSEERLKVRVRMEAHTHEGEDWKDQKHMVLRRGGRWSQLDPADLRPVAGLEDTQEVELLLPGFSEEDSTLFVSNFYWWPYSEVVEYVQALEGVRVREIGRSFQDRPIFAVEMGRHDADAPCMVHAQACQPSEMLGSLACRAMIDYLLSDDDEAISIRDRFRVCFVPVTNPDGAVLGYGVSDAQGRFPHFEGHQAAKGDPQASPETAALWEYLKEQRPWLFWDWHSNCWFRRPGHVLIRYRSDMLADTRMRRLWDEIEEQLLALPNTHHESWSSHTEGPPAHRNTPGFQVVDFLGSIVCRIKQHDKYPLAQSRDHAVDCLKIAARCYSAAGK